MKYAIHIPTGKRCRIMSWTATRAFCDFEEPVGPFYWVELADLKDLP